MQAVYGWGYPGGGIIKAFQGTISGQREDKIFLNNIDLAPGNSGGPLLSMKTDKIIGIILQKAANQTDQYASAIDFLVIYLQKDPVLKKVVKPELSVSTIRDRFAKRLNVNPQEIDINTPIARQFNISEDEFNSIWWKIESDYSPQWYCLSAEDLDKEWNELSISMLYYDLCAGE